MNFTQKSRLDLPVRVVNGQWIPRSAVAANGAGIELAEGQAFVSFALISDTEIEADQLGNTIGYEEIPSDDEKVNDNAIFGSAGKDKILGLTGSDLPSGGAGNDVIYGGEGNDLIAGGKGADNIQGGDGDDYISSSADVNKSHQAINGTDTWSAYGLPAGSPPISTQARFGVYESQEADGGKVTVWSGIGSTREDTAATEGDVIDAGAGNDRVIGSWAADRIKGGTGDDSISGLAGDDIIEGNEGDDNLSGDGIVKASYLNSVDAANHGADFIDGGASSRITTNSIANYVDNITGNCSKRFKNRRETSFKLLKCRKHKPNQQIAVIEPAQSATEFIVIGAAQ